jgi:hypothetical protein
VGEKQGSYSMFDAAEKIRERKRKMKEQADKLDDKPIENPNQTAKGVELVRKMRKKGE